MAGLVAGALVALAACAPVSVPGNGTGNYVVCDDTVANSTCPADTAPVVVNNSL